VVKKKNQILHLPKIKALHNPQQVIKVDNIIISFYSNCKKGKQVEPSAPEMNSNMFGNMQIKAKPVGGTKPKGFDPFNLGAPNKSGQTNFPGEGGPFGKNEQIPMSGSGHGSLTRIEGDETPTSMTEGLGEPKKVSAFGFMQKQPIKIQTNQPQGLSFVTNADPSPQRMYEGEPANFNEYGEKRPSLTSLASEPVNTGAQKGPGSAFSFIKKVINDDFLYVKICIEDKCHRK